MNRWGILLATLLLVPALAAAQGAGPEPLTLDISPRYPGPYDTVQVTPMSTLIDLPSATTALFVNGKQVATATGGAPFSVPMQGPGVLVSIQVRAIAGGKTYIASISLRPSAVALVLEPISTTHPFYEGAPLLASEGRARLIAIPDLRTGSGARLDPTKLSYSWRLGEQQLQAQSGIGRSVLTLTGPVRYRDATAIVTVTSPENGLAAQTSLTLSPIDPLVLLYRNDPLLGPLYDTAIGNTYAMHGEEDGLIGVPYFFSVVPRLAWSVAGNDGGTDSSVTLRTTGSGAGSAGVSLSATGATTFEIGSAQTAVSFSSSNTSSGIFGL